MPFLFLQNVDFLVLTFICFLDSIFSNILSQFFGVLPLFYFFFLSFPIFCIFYWQLVNSISISFFSDKLLYLNSFLVSLIGSHLFLEYNSIFSQYQGLQKLSSFVIFVFYAVIYLCLYISLFLQHKIKHFYYGDSWVIFKSVR